MKISASLIAFANGKFTKKIFTPRWNNEFKIFAWEKTNEFYKSNFKEYTSAGRVDFFGAQRTTVMNTPDAPFCIGCNDAELGQFPWQLSLQTTGHFCGGSILSATALSTAAHCRKSSYYAVAGTIDNQKGQKIQTSIFISHPGYNGNLIINDFAVGKVRTPFNLNEYAQPIPLVNPSETRPVEGHPLRTSGYGYYKTNILGRPVSQVSRYLKWTDIEYVSVETCKNIIPSQTIDNSVICADTEEASVQGSTHQDRNFYKSRIVPLLTRCKETQKSRTELSADQAACESLPQSVLVILVDHLSFRRKVNGDLLVWHHGLMFIADPDIHRVGQTFNGQNIMHGWEKMPNLKTESIEHFFIFCIQSVTGDKIKCPIFFNCLTIE